MQQWIDEPEALRARIAAWQGQARVGLDTEFIRERTYYPQLALVQLSVPGEVLLVDPLAEGVAEALRPLLLDPGMLKIMHSASEDLQALLRGCQALPAPMFDTQVAAALAGMGGGLGYQKLVEKVTGVALEKGETRSDWLRRPLSESQLRYAADDVLHLHELHAVLDARLRWLGRLDWLMADGERALQSAASEGDDPMPHLALRNAQTLDAAGQARVRRLLMWRDAEARRSDRPKGWVLDNELAVQLSRRPFDNFHAFNVLLDANPKAPRRARKELFELLTRPLDEDEGQLPLNRAGEALDKQRLRTMQEAVAALAGSLGIPEGLLCARRHLEALLDGRGWPEALQGWRRSLLEPVLEPLLP
jgi:ribonuclease D